MTNSPDFLDPKKYTQANYLIWVYAPDLGLNEPQIVDRELLLEMMLKPSQIEFGGWCWRECADYFEEKYGYEYGS
ncbi:hypothetical protein [Nostoc sp. 106C]|uniref:hypothetical protein n=1 Tax=Nostoc sp. 106C TaxID=1932667 RepID=UPI000A3C1323|nr:hypothetical protein [Nostoc sp. 106C]OUL28793.1 hypothetical protein BV375_16885 [Nostoc sp. 106C]